MLSAEAWQGLVPKRETQALDFVRAQAAWDGRGVVVGVLDTGVDPAAVGLQLTSAGLPKVLDIVDCSGSGDVAMSDATVDGLGIRTCDGRTLLPGAAWTNPSGRYKVGMKRAFELYPRGLRERVLEERRKAFMKAHGDAELALQRQLLVAGADPEDARSGLALLKTYEALEDPGPVYDCVVWHDGTEWLAVVNTEETEDLQRCEPMACYRSRRQYQRFSDLDALSFCVNVFDEGSVLSIVVDAGAHGSHVAGIVGCFHEASPELNGVAPGAQIVSLKIGDSRLGSMETGASLVRALIEAKRRGCDLINMSFGEATACDNAGMFVRLAEDLVVNHNIAFLASAGNNGPALSTVGSPGGTSSAIIGVAAYVSTSMMVDAYSMLETTPETNYTWSSVGPCIDGDAGVSIMAPGAAITAVPSWTLQRSQLMNGTSMSSPNACGCVALLLSAAKASGMKVSTALVRRALENSALRVPGVDWPGQGGGLVQVQAAWALMQTLAEDPMARLHMRVGVLGDRFKRGIYLRGAAETRVSDSFRAEVTPLFADAEGADDKIAFEVRVTLESSAPWVQCPAQLLLGRGGKQFSVRVDPCALATGLHCAVVRGFEEGAPHKGPLFQLPVTVAKPEVVPDGTQDWDLGAFSFEEERRRRFFVPPAGCSFVDVVVRDARQSEGGADHSTRTLAVHALQLMPGVPYRDFEKQAYFTLAPGSLHVLSLAVHAGVPVELVLARLWSASPRTACAVTLQFRGVTPAPAKLHLLGGCRVSPRVKLTAQLMTVALQPVAKLDTWKSTVKPTASGKVSPLGERDVLLSGKPIYQLVLEYAFELADALEATHLWPGLQGVLYESEFHGQFFMVFDAKKKLMHVGDAWPKKCKLTKGKYVVRLQVRHESSAVLDKLVDMPMILSRALKTSIALTAFRTKSDALIAAESDALPSRTLSVGTSTVLYFKEPSFEQLPKGAKPGDCLVGSVTYLKKNGNAIGAADRPSGYSLIYTVADSGPAAVAKQEDASAATPEPSEKLAEVVRDAKIKHVKGLIGGASFDEIYGTVVAEYPESIALKLHRVTHLRKQLDAEAAKGSDSEEAVIRLREECVGACDDVARLVDSEELARALGVLLPLIGKELEEKKAALIAVYTVKANLALDEAEQQKPPSLDSYDAAVKELQKWVDINSDKFWRLHFTKHKLQNKWGLALKKVSDILTAINDGKAVPPDTSYDKLVKESLVCLDVLGWHHIRGRYAAMNKIAVKPDYDLF